MMANRKLAEITKLKLGEEMFFFSREDHCSTKATSKAKSIACHYRKQASQAATGRIFDAGRTLLGKKEPSPSNPYVL